MKRYWMTKERDYLQVILKEFLLNPKKMKNQRHN